MNMSREKIIMTSKKETTRGRQKMDKNDIVGGRSTLKISRIGPKMNCGNQRRAV